MSAVNHGPPHFSPCTFFNGPRYQLLPNPAACSLSIQKARKLVVFTKRALKTHPQACNLPGGTPGPSQEGQLPACWWRCRTSLLKACGSCSPVTCPGWRSLPESLLSSHCLLSTAPWHGFGQDAAEERATCPEEQASFRLSRCLGGSCGVR